MSPPVPLLSGAPPSPSPVALAPPPPRATPAAAPRFRPELDGLRAAAILLVLLHHLPARASLGPALGMVAAAGWCGVDLFFVLSGYLITGLLDDAKGSPRYFRDFYLRRALRIFPVFYLYLALLAALSMRELLLHHGRELAVETAFASAYLTNVLIAIRGDFLSRLTTPLWSLSVEEHFYLLWPLVVLRLDRRRLGQLAAALMVIVPLARVVAAARGVSAHAIYSITPLRLDALAAGALLAVLRRELPEGRWPRRTLRVAGLACLAAFVALVIASHGVAPYRAPRSSLAEYPLLAIAAVWLVSEALGGGRLGVLLSWPPLTFLGRYSYGLYLWHSAVFVILGTWLRGVAERFAGGPSWLASSLSSLALVAAAMAVAVASYHLFEARFLRLKDRFAPRVRPAPVPLRGSSP